MMTKVSMIARSKLAVFYLGSNDLCQAKREG